MGRNGAGLSGNPSSTTGFEKRWNPALLLDAAAFIVQLTQHLPPRRPTWMRSCSRALHSRAEPMTTPVIRLGLRENLGQFSLLVLVNAFVGAMVGLERSILPAIAEQEFHIAARAAILSFIVVFGITKALTNYFAGGCPTASAASVCSSAAGWSPSRCPWS